MKQATLLTLAAIFVCTLHSCKKVDSGDLKEDVPWHQFYMVAYNKTNNLTTARAEFRIRTSNGTKVELTGDASIKANNISATIDNVFPASYSWVFNNALPDLQFVLTKNAQKTLNNSVSIKDVGDINIPASVASFSKSLDISFNWEGAALDSNDHMTATMTQLSPSNTTSLSISGLVHDYQVLFKATDLKMFQPGKLSVSLRRYKEIALDNADGEATGYIEASIETSKEVTLTQ